MSHRDEILDKIKTVEGLPAAASQVLEIVQDEDSDMNDIVRAIELDPGLTANVLRLANSAYFAGPGKVGSLREAAVLFGTNRIQQLVLANAVFPMVSGSIKGYDLEPGRLLDNLIAVAIGTEELARVLHETPPPSAFTAGLLHGIGKVVLGTFVEIDAAPIIELAYEKSMSFDEAERTVLGIDHAEVGACLLEEWGFPEDLVQAVRWQYQPEAANEVSFLLDLVHVAGNLSMECGLGAGIDGLNYRVSEGSVERLRMNTKIAELVTFQMLTELASIKETLLHPSKGS
jgi:putative nucleotidyltransferase with HDIG domain